MRELEQTQFGGGTPTRHLNVLLMIAWRNRQTSAFATCNTDARETWWMLTGFASREFEKSNIGPNRFSSTEICELVNKQSPVLEEGDKMIFKNLKKAPPYTEDEEVVTLYYTTDLSLVPDVVANGLPTAFGVGCIDTSAVYGCPVPLAYASKIEPHSPNTAHGECTWVLLTSESRAIFNSTWVCQSSR